MNRKRVILLIALAVISLTFIGLLIYFKDRTSADREKMKPYLERQEQEKKKYEKEGGN